MMALLALGRCNEGPGRLLRTQQDQTNRLGETAAAEGDTMMLGKNNG